MKNTKQTKMWQVKIKQSWLWIESKFKQMSFLQRSGKTEKIDL